MRPANSATVAILLILVAAAGLATAPAAAATPAADRGGCRDCLNRHAGHADGGGMRPTRRPAPTDRPVPRRADAATSSPLERLEPRRLMSATVHALPAPAEAVWPVSGGPAVLIDTLRHGATRASYPLPAADWEGAALHRVGTGFVGPIEALRPGAPFYLFDALDRAGSSSGLSGLPTMATVDASGLTAAGARAAARSATAAGELLLLDVSRLRLDGRSDAPGDVRADLLAAGRLVDAMRAERPGVRVGLYGAAPLFDAGGGDWDMVKRFLADDAGPRGRWRGDYLAWRAANDALGPLAARFDFVAPSLETAYLDPAGWDSAARGSIAEARRVAPGKPVIAVLRPQVGPNSRHAGRAVPEDFWSDQLELALGYADGAALAGPPGRAAGGGMADHGVLPDGGGADWPAATAEFLDRHRGGVATPLKVPVGGGDPATEPVIVGRPGDDRPASQPAAPAADLFPVYDTLLQIGRPSSEALGFERMAFSNHNDTSDIALKQHADRAARDGVPIMFNAFEHEKVDARVNSPAEVEAALAKIGRAADLIRAHSPGLEFGFYSIFPRRDLWSAVGAAGVREQLAASDAGLTRAEVDKQGYLADHYDRHADGKWRLKEYARHGLVGKLMQKEVPERAWKAANDRIAAVAAKVPVIYPSIYLFYEDPELNALYIKAQVAEAKRYGKKVLPVIQMNYHESNAKHGNGLIGPDVMRAAVRAAGEAGADGLVLWGGDATWRPQDTVAAGVVRDAAAEVARERAAARAAD